MNKNEDEKKQELKSKSMEEGELKMSNSSKKNHGKESDINKVEEVVVSKNKCIRNMPTLLEGYSSSDEDSDFTTKDKKEIIEKKDKETCQNKEKTEEQTKEKEMEKYQNKEKTKEKENEKTKEKDNEKSIKRNHKTNCEIYSKKHFEYIKEYHERIQEDIGVDTSSSSDDDNESANYENVFDNLNGSYAQVEDIISDRKSNDAFSTENIRQINPFKKTDDKNGMNFKTLPYNEENKLKNEEECLKWDNEKKRKLDQNIDSEYVITKSKKQNQKPNPKDILIKNNIEEINNVLTTNNLVSETQELYNINRNTINYNNNIIEMDYNHGVVNERNRCDSFNQYTNKNDTDKITTNNIYTINNNTFINNYSNDYGYNNIYNTGIPNGNYINDNYNDKYNISKKKHFPFGKSKEFNVELSSIPIVKQQTFSEYLKINKNGENKKNAKYNIKTKYYNSIKNKLEETIAGQKNQKRKHQINWLAKEAIEKEWELLQKKGYDKKYTKDKYGW